MGLMSWLWPKSSRAQKNEIYRISNIEAFEKAVDRVYQTAHNGKTTKSSIQVLELRKGDFVTCIGDSNNGLPSFVVTIGEAWKNDVINMSPSAHAEPELYGLSTLNDSEKRKFTPRQRNLVR